MKYKCLVLDHDDTVVKSTPEIHYPSFADAMRVLRPEVEPLTLEEFLTYSFSPGFAELCEDIVKLSKEEQAYQYKVWKSYTKERIPEFYEGFIEIIREYHEAGGIICVVSHSESELIIRDYELHCGLKPDMVFGWELGEDKRKPRPYPLQEIMRQYKLDSSDLLMVDDLKPGLDMAKSCSVDFAGAGWSHMIPQIEEYMRDNAEYYFSTVEEFRKFIFS